MELEASPAGRHQLNGPDWALLRHNSGDQGQSNLRIPIVGTIHPAMRVLWSFVLCVVECGVVLCSVLSLAGSIVNIHASRLTVDNNPPARLVTEKSYVPQLGCLGGS